MKTCLDGELCNGSGFVRDAAGDRFCTCRQLRLRRTRLLEGGFPLKEDGPAAAWTKAGCPGTALHPEIETFAARFALGADPNKVLVVWPHAEPTGGLRSPRALATDMMSIAAFLFPVVQVTARDLIDAAFDRLGRAKLAQQAEDVRTAVMVGVGTDASHAYAGPLLFDLLRRRAAFAATAAPTLVVVEGTWARGLMVYGELFMRALVQYRPLCGCARP